MLLSKYDEEWMNLIDNDPTKFLALDDVIDKRNNLNKFKSEFHQQIQLQLNTKCNYTCVDMMIVKDSADPTESDSVKEDHTFYIPRVATKRGAILSWALPTT